MKFGRRRFLRSAAISAAFAAFGQVLSARQTQGRSGGAGRGGRGATAAPPQPQGYLSEIEGYGPLVPDPHRILDLPKGFSYRILSHTGNAMDDGFLVPGMPDGMAAFTGANGRVILVRNHELNPDNPALGPFGWTNELYSHVDPSFVYDKGKGRPHLGGTTTLVYDPVSGRVERQFLSLVGTTRNCAGGETPWNAWISCEETTMISGDDNENEKDHGYAFEIPAAAATPVKPQPLKAMGRFVHEAVAVDPHTSIVYQTEDQPDGLIYRFLPNAPRNLAAGGRLQALAVRGQKTCDTRNFAETGAPRLTVGEPLAVEWIDLEEVDTQRDDLRSRGAHAGAALFSRGEGMWFGNSEVYFAATDGGLSKRGQIFRYRPSPTEGTPSESKNPGQLELYLEPDNAAIMESVDNLVVAPWGDLFLCEDNAAPAPTVVRQNASNYVRGVTKDGKVFTFARNRYFGVSELAGACFAPNHPTMFLNIQNPGFTLAIAGPWGSLRR